MTLAELSGALATVNTPALLDQLVVKDGSAITLAMLNTDVSSPSGLQELDSVYSSFAQSGAGATFFKKQVYTPAIDFFLELFGLAYERIEHGRIKTIAALVRTHSLKKRLRALSIIQKDCGFGYDNYTTNFPVVVALLTEAQYDPDDASADYTGYVLRILHYFKAHAAKWLAKSPVELARFQVLFSLPENLSKWPLLAEDIEPIVALPIDAQGFDFSKAPPFPLLPSRIFADLFDKLVDFPLRNDHRTPRKNLSNPLGYDSNFARNEIIQHGTADFRAAYKNLSTDDMVLIYCLYNLRMHFFSSYYIYSVFIDNILNLLTENYKKLVFLDLGCGPLTSGLALADLFLERFSRPIPMQYVGVDIAPAMLAKANEFAREQALFAETSFHFQTDLNDTLNLLVHQLIRSNNTIIINTSYLFASSSLVVADLAAFVSKLHAMCPNSPIFLIFQNPAATYRNTKYVQWKAQLTEFESVYQSIIPVEYQNKLDGSPSKPERVYYELLSYKL